MLVKTKIRFLFLAFFIVTIFLTTCDSPMGMGQPIDWEAPVLTMDPVPNPLYVREGTTLTGTATDNVGIERIVFINTATDEELFPVDISGDNWSITLLFTSEQNGEKIVGEIRAYDKMNNSDGNSVAIVTMIVDIRPPVVESIAIQRTDTRIARLETLTVLQALETTDPRGEKKDELYKYQNGWFYINAVVNDEETKIEIISLDFYDVGKDINDKLISLPVDDGYTNYFPRWSIKEENIINAGVAKWGADYKTNYYKKDGDRYYYRVVIKAIDKSNNETVEENEGYICMWAKSDEPKGIFDPIIGTVVSRGTPLPVDFFDDDSLAWAYAGLLTEEQWNGDAEINTSKYIPAGTDEFKLAWLKDYLLGGNTVYNWLYDKHSGIPADQTSEPIKELIDKKSLDEKLVYVATGKGESDYGHYVLFTLAADKKLPPHDANGPEWTNTNIWTGKAYAVSVIDENAPLIVFDTSTKDGNGNPKLFCPEENTFPVLTDGEFFNIVGYTLRENASGMNKVTKFRMAWIPYNMPDLPDKPKGADGYIRLVQDALSNDFTGMPAGVHYWDFTDSATSGPGKFYDEGNEFIETNEFRKQSFVKKMSVLGRADDIKTTTENFKYGGRLENETKLFVFYAVDNMGHEVFRQLRLLSNKTPPDLAVYDVSNYLDNSIFPGMPDSNDAKYNTGGGLVNSTYYPDLKTYNEGKYSTIKGVIGTYVGGVQVPSQYDRTIPFQIYPRGTIVKYWINAENSGDIAVDKISMKDITYSSDGVAVGSVYNTTSRDITFCEYYPDVTQRTFLFEATDKLGNVARIQRTVAVTNAAKLENITTTSQTGTYGIGKVITLQANFSSQVYVMGPPPVLNIRYNSNGSPIYVTIPCTNSPMPDSSSNSTSILEFKFTVPQYSGGIIETIYDDITFTPPSGNKRPIILPDGTKIMDSNRNDSAFIPGYQNESVTMPNWADKKNSLQEKKTISLDGVRPRITSVTVGGKTPVGGYYYFKSGETLELTLNANEDIRASGTPYLRYVLLNKAGVPIENNENKFKYQRPNGQTALVFSIPVSDISSVDGRFSNFALLVTSGIVDNADNAVEASTVEALQSLIASTPEIYIKKSIPAAPDAHLTGTTTSNFTGNTPASSNTLLYNVNPYLTIDDSKATWNDLEDVKEYSLDGGLSWVTFNTAKSGWTTLVGGNLTINNGTWDLRVRYKDRAGNEGNQTRQLIRVNKDFPRLVSITAVQPDSTYKQGDKLEFNLEFAEPVKTTDNNDAKITISNRVAIAGNTTEGSVTPSYEIVLTAKEQSALSTTIKFEWTLNGKEMPDGLYVSKVEFAGYTSGPIEHIGALQDSFGNHGVNSSAATTAIITLPNGNCVNLNGAALKVDCITPKLNTYLPSNGGVSTDNRTISITFNESVMIGTGTITVRPYGNYKIPAVLENEGYYLKTDGTRYTTPQTDATGKKTTTWVAGFSDIYNSLTSSPDRNTLTKGTSMSNLELDIRTGLSVGPYKKMTHGLKAGSGYSGNYSGTAVPNPSEINVMIPDTATKWVLDYRYSIDNNHNTGYVDYDNVKIDGTTYPSVVPAIRDVLTRAKWRWQEMDLVSSVSFSNDNKTVTITMNEPLLDGLKWGISFPKGAFTDKAGNEAAALNYDPDNNSYWFWSKGVQSPVIRVNRKSFDARTRGPAVPTATGFNNLDDSWKDFRRVYSVPANMNFSGGWGIGDFNTVHYQIETETPGAAIYYGTREGKDRTGGRIIGAWTNTNIGSSTYTWTSLGNTAVANDWVLPNLVRRRGATSYSATENGYSVTITITDNYKGYRSYNSDILKTTLDGTSATISAGTDWYEGFFTYDSGGLEASKNYVVAEARITNGSSYTSGKSNEGIFRSVIALNQNNNDSPPTAGLQGRNLYRGPTMVQGSNVKNGMPSVAGFPVKDADEEGDNRFIKLFYYVGHPTTALSSETGLASYQMYWVSTEIVSQWYVIMCSKQNQNNGGATNGVSHQSYGDVNNYLTAGYGDLSYAYNLR